MGSNANADAPGRPTLPTPADQHGDTTPTPPAEPPPAESPPALDDDAAAEARRRAALCDEIRAGWKRALGH